MSVYFEKRLSTSFGDVCNDILWYNDIKVAVSFKSQTDGSFIGIFDTQCALLNKLSIPGNNDTIGSISWHPRGSLNAAWGSTLATWSDEEAEVTIVESPHRAPIRLLLHSPQGGRLISTDTAGGVVGWNSSGRHLLTSFHHELNAYVTHAVFRFPNNHGLNLRDAAKAAVAGDERALDLFSSTNMFGWRPKTAGRRTQTIPYEYRDGMDFYAATDNGIILYISENGRCEEVLDLGCGCCQMLYRTDSDQLIVLTEYLSVIQLHVEPEGGLREIMKVKLSGDSRDFNPNMIWAGTRTVAIALGGQLLRLWDLDSGDTDVLNLPATAPVAEHLISLAYSSGQVLCGGTNAGNLFFWTSEGNEWTLSGTTFVSTPVKQLSWGGDILVVSTLSNVYQLRRNPLSASFAYRVGCVQTSGNIVLIYINPQSAEPLKHELVTDMQIQGLSVSQKYCLLFSEGNVEVYSLLLESKNELAIQKAGKFECQCLSSGLYDESLIILEPERATVRTIQGTVKQMLFLVPTEGIPIILGSLAHFTALVTSQGLLKFWDMSRREAKNHGRPKNLRDLIENYGEAMSVCCNCDGTKVALTIADAELIPVNQLYILDVEADHVQAVTDFAVSNEDGCESSHSGNLLITHFAWDEEEPRLLVAHARNSNRTRSMLLCMWVSQDDGIFVHEKIELKSHATNLLNCSAPYVTFLSSTNANKFEFITLGDFVGVPDMTPTVKKSILNFSYNLAVGNMDLAFKAINSVNSESVWMNLARKCVRTKRLDVALVCMGRTGKARVAAAMRRAEKEPELDARVAVLALNLGMVDEAKTLLRGCGRFDLLNKLHQSLTQWDEAVNVAEESDRMHLRATHHLRGKWLEQSGLVDSALQAYEQADTHRLHAPRLLVDDPDRLKAYVDNSNDSTLLKWYAQFVESVGDMQSALQYYTRAGDICSSVRVLCFVGDLARASEVVLLSGNRAAAYHLARQLEAMDKIDEALLFFTKAAAFGNAIRICKEQGFIDKIWSLALQGSVRDQIDAAQFLLASGEVQKAASLYQRAGHPQRALELALQGGDYDALDLVAPGLEQQLEGPALEKLAEALIERQQYARAVEVLAAAGKITDAIALCVNHSVTMTDELADKLNASEPDRVPALLQVANCALGQENYHLAAKKFTQAGEKVQAMKALLKSGDTEKIIFLASVSREKDVYVMAANYLQALDWRANPQLLNTVIQFYTKAKAHNALANFYMACANVEVDEYDDLDKAVAALGEARRSISRLPEDAQSRRAMETIEKRTHIVQQLQKARIAFESGQAEEGSNICRQIIPLCDHDGPVTKGRVLAFMLLNEQNPATARKIYEELKSCMSDPSKLVPPTILASLGVLASTSPDDLSPN